MAIIEIVYLAKLTKVSKVVSSNWEMMSGPSILISGTLLKIKNIITVNPKCTTPFCENQKSSYIKVRFKNKQNALFLWVLHLVNIHTHTTLWGSHIESLIQLVPHEYGRDTWAGILFCMFFRPPPALPGVPFVQFHVRRTCTLSSLAFKGVTCRSTIKAYFPSPLSPHVHEGTTRCLEQVPGVHHF